MFTFKNKQISLTFVFILNISENQHCMKLSWKREILYLKETFSIAHGKYNFRETLVVMLASHGETGYGECVAIDYYGIDLDVFVLKLHEIKQEIESAPMVVPQDFYTFLTTLNLHSFLSSALDCAYWDLFGKLENKSFFQLNDLNGNLPESSFTISVSPVEEQVRKILASPWQNFKVKCNGLNRADIFKLLETGKEIALDSNTSFSEDDCRFLQENELTKNFVYIEQPRPVGEYRILNKNLYANWMADEDCQDISYLEKLRPHYSAINVKLMKCGGLTPALELIREARKLKFKVMIGCMTESSVGISAGIALAPLCDYADLDGANLISNDFSEGSSVENGRLLLSEKPGLGISMRKTNN
ncbi:Muconate cycloisomerase [Flavobacteriaceae bacterium 3519-10]|nr:Muconate cycloisomerase [Flavobacteriaceae bacterium 3519-10]